MGSKIYPPIVAVFGKNLAVLELWDLVTLATVVQYARLKSSLDFVLVTTETLTCENVLHEPKSETIK